MFSPYFYLHLSYVKRPESIPHTLQHTDSLLLDRWKSGDQSAFETLYERYAVMLLKKAYEKTGNRETAREFVQEVFLELLERKDRLDIHTSFKAYIFTALRNRVLNYLHRQSIHHKYEIFQKRALQPRAMMWNPICRIRN